VFDIDSVQLLQTYSRLASDASIVGEAGLNGGGPFCLGGVASPLADPQEMQLMRLAKKVAAGARFLITQPVFDLERFAAWLEEVRRRGIHQQAAIVAGILPLTCAVRARQLAQARPQPGIPEALLERIAGRPDAAAQRAEGIQVAVETIRKLSAVEGLRGFQVSGDWDPEAALEVLEKSGLGVA
jgi:methylenetetrahydrofolate reductase (NADPH)